MRHLAKARLVSPADQLTVDMLPIEIVEQIRAYSLDSLIDQRQHLPWAQVLSSSEFIRLRGFLVLLPLSANHHPYLKATHIYMETHEDSLVFLLTDATPTEQADQQTADQFLVVAQKFPQQPFFITTLFHVCQLKLRR